MLGKENIYRKIGVGDLLHMDNFCIKNVMC